jgi:hypothetical protein
MVTMMKKDDSIDNVWEIMSLTCNFSFHLFMEGLKTDGI